MIEMIRMIKEQKKGWEVATIITIVVLFCGILLMRSYNLSQGYKEYQLISSYGKISSFEGKDSITFIYVYKNTISKEVNKTKGILFYNELKFVAPINKETEIIINGKEKTFEDLEKIMDGETIGIVILFDRRKQPKFVDVLEIDTLH